MPTAEQALKVARSFIGIVEKPPNSNRTPIGEEFGWNGVAWCAEATSVILKRIGLTPNVDFPYSASVAVCFEWYDKHNRMVKKANIQPGDQLRATISHTFLAEKKPRGGRVQTLEGNTSPGSGGSQRDGGGFYRRSRPMSFIRSAARPKYRADAATAKVAAKPTTTNQAVKPQPEKGFFGMSGYEQYKRIGDQTIPAKGRARVRTHPATKTSAGPHFMARPRRKGQKFMLQADVTVHRIPQGADVKAQLVVAKYAKGKPVELLRPFEQVTFTDGINGTSTAQIAQPEAFGWTPNANTRYEYQIEVQNYSASPIIVNRVRTAAFYE